MAKKSKIFKSAKLLKAKEQYLKSGVKKVNRLSTRGVNRCKITGRPRGFMRYFGISRLTFREMVAKGELPGVVKSSK